MMVQHHVADYGVFSEHEATRRQHGATGHAIDPVMTDPDTIVVNDFASADGIRAFIEDPTLPAAMERGGVDVRRRSGSWKKRIRRATSQRRLTDLAWMDLLPARPGSQPLGIR